MHPHPKSRDSRKLEARPRTDSLTLSQRLGWSGLALAVALTPALVALLLLPRRQFLALHALMLLVLPAGRFVILAPVIDPNVPFDPWAIAPLVALIDSALALLVTVNLELLHRLPLVGSELAELQARARSLVSQQRWMRRLAEAGVLLFVSLPLPGTGPIGGSMVARFSGLGRATSVAVVAAGSAFGAAVMAIGADTLALALSPLQDSEWLGLVRLGVLCFLLALLLLAARRKGKSSRRPRPPLST